MIEVNNISFKYAGGKNLVFDDFSLELKQVTLVGINFNPKKRNIDMPIVEPA